MGGKRGAVEARAPVNAAERQRLARVFGRVRTRSHEVEEPRRETRERQQVQAVVLEYRGKRPRIAGPHEPEIAGRNLESRYVADPPRAEHVRLEGHERAA